MVNEASSSSNNRPVKGFDGLPQDPPEKSQVGDFFAPFFDVVFYKASKEHGVIYEDTSVGTAIKAPPTEGYAEEYSRSVGVEDLQRNDTIGASVIRIKTSGGGFKLYTADGEISDLRNYTSDLTIEGISSESYRATLTIQPPLADAIKLLDSEAIVHGSLMEIQWGYLNANGGEPVLSSKGLFRVLEPSARFGESTVITINGQDILSSLGGSLDTRRTWNRPQKFSLLDNPSSSDIFSSGGGSFSLIPKAEDKNYATDLEILTELAEKISPTIVVDASRISENSKLRKLKTGDPITQVTTDFKFFQRICELNDVAYIIEGQKVILMDMTTSDLLDPSYNLLWYRQPDERKDIPMIAFEANSITSLFAPLGSRGIKTFSHNLDDDEVSEAHDEQEKKGSFPGNTTNVRTGEKGVGEEPSAGTASGEVSTKRQADKGQNTTAGRAISEPNEVPSREDEQDHRMRRLRRLANTRADVTIPGHPAVIPTMIVGVFGVGKAFGGRYRVLRVRHSLGSGGYTTGIELLRGTTSGDEAGSGPKASKPRSTKRAADSGTGNEVPPKQAEPSSVTVAPPSGFTS